MAWLLGTRVKDAWDAFWNNKDPTVETNKDGYIRFASTNASRPDRLVYACGNERTIVASIFNRITTDVAVNNIRHVKLDDRGRYNDTIRSSLNNALSIEANIDQTGRAMIADAVSTMLDEGCVAIVPVTTDKDPAETESYNILELRIGKIVQWRPQSVLVEVYNENTGLHSQIYMAKNHVAIVENPFYSIMNEPNSTLKRLIRKLNLLDKIDNDIGSNKFDIIIQLPYISHTEAKKRQANTRRKEIEEQLNGSKLGVAYIDAAEKVIQLNRPLENTLMGQIEYLTNQVMSQLGITPAILENTADENTLNNYNHRIVEPILLALTEEMERKFLSKTARTQGHAIRFFADQFRLVPTSKIPDIADKLTRNEIMSSNEFRQILGLKPSDQPEADELRNKNLNRDKNELRQGSSPSLKGRVDGRGMVRRIFDQSRNQNGEET